MIKFYTAQRAPNPRAIENILAIKQIEVETIEIDLIGGENRGDAFTKINPAGQLPALQTEDGQIIAEVAAIAEYLEEVKPDPVLVGANAAARAHTRMRMRQVDYLVLGPMMMAYRNSEGADFFKSRMRIQPEIGAPLKLVAADGLVWLDQQMQGCDFICGDQLTYVDCAFYPLVAFLAKVSQPIDPALENLTAYMQRLSAHEVIGAKTL
jgi:glutathione S-transferase